jgi:hypothetical protein
VNVVVGLYGEKKYKHSHTHTYTHSLLFGGNKSAPLHLPKMDDGGASTLCLKSLGKQMKHLGMTYNEYSQAVERIAVRRAHRNSLHEKRSDGMIQEVDRLPRKAKGE